MTVDGLYEYSPTPDTSNICQTSSVAGPGQIREALFSIRPNPVSEHLNIRWLQDPPPDLELVLFNAHGVEVLRRLVAEKQAVSVAHLPAGFYFIRTVSKGRFTRAVKNFSLPGSITETAGPLNSRPGTT